MSQPGVSLIVCTHNGARRLPPTLAHLAAQRTPPGLGWEVVVVDNASSDDTAAVARAAWQAGAPAPLRVIAEPRVGVGHARARGIEDAAYEVAGFVDDDNWLAPDWVAHACEVMTAHPDVGACGSRGEPVFEGEAPPPEWFAANAHSFAVGDQGPPGDVGGGPLWGAALLVRRRAWQAVGDAGFEPALTGRRGSMSAAGEDTELCWALNHAGWRLWYEPRLRFRHAIPVSRLTWEYLCAIHYGFGVASVTMDHYHIAGRPAALPRRRRLESWTWRVLAAAGRGAWHAVRARLIAREDRRDALRAQIARGRLHALLEGRREFREGGRRAAAMARRLERARR
jgi:GT2 family glycosyltransferase